MEMMLKCDFRKKRKFIFQDRIIASYSRPIKVKYRKI